MQATTHIVTLNVSGKRFHSTKTTLCRSPFLKALVENLPEDPQKQLVPFIDRDARAFRHILSLLRDPAYPFPKGLAYELNFYGLTLPNLTNTVGPEVTKYVLFGDILAMPEPDKVRLGNEPVQLVPMHAPLTLVNCQFTYQGMEVECEVSEELESSIKACGGIMNKQSQLTKFVLTDNTKIFIKDSRLADDSCKGQPEKLQWLDDAKLSQLWKTHEKEGLHMAVVPVLKSLAKNVCDALLVVTSLRGHKFQ